MNPLKMFRLIKINRATLIIILVFCLSGLTSYAGQQDKNQQLYHSVLLLTQQCDDSKNKDQLLKIIADIDILLGQIEAGDQAKKKLYIIRLKKSRSMCHYFLQLQED